jgi:alpha-N-arabinofuranosidase
VSPNGFDSNDGSKSKPFKTISAAAKIALPVDVITIHEGTYREYINPLRGGTSNEKRIIYRAAPGEKVIIKGSEVIKGWKKVEHDTWKVTLPNSFFGDYNPYNTVIEGEWHKHGGYPRHTGTVYLNGTWMNEAETLEDVLKPTSDRQSPIWFGQVNESHTTIWAQFKGVDPNQELVEINVRQCIFYPDQPGRNYITVRGFTMRQAATPWSGAMSEQVGLIGTHWSKGWIIEDNIISHSVNTGITLGRYDLGRYGVAMPAATAPGFVESCELALKHGWSKENIGSHIVRNNHISHCEKNGIHGSLGGIFSIIEGNTIHEITRRGWVGGADMAGLKLLAANDVIIRNNHIYNCKRGMWLDWMIQGTRISRNLLHDNSRDDIHFEVNHGPYLVDHNMFLSQHSLKDLSQGSAYVHNLFAGTTYAKLNGRETPYFKPHSIKEMKLSNIQNKDARFYNNIILDPKFPPPGYIEERLQLAGNVHPQNFSVTVEEREDGFWLRMPWLPAAKDSVLITTELLGKAAIPNAPFEKPDGTPYRLDSDYFGKKRSVKNPNPGPFVLQDGEEILLKVWPRK